MARAFCLEWLRKFLEADTTLLVEMTRLSAALFIPSKISEKRKKEKRF